jgi:thymidylate kinase
MQEVGKLLVFEGPDGVGKSTLAQGLTTHMEAHGVPCKYLAFPGREPGTLGHHVYMLHHDLPRFGIESIAPVSLQLLHIAAHIDAIERAILPALRCGQHVILDRFWWSTWVYGMVAGVPRQSLEDMIRLEITHWDQTIPSAVFLIERSASLRPAEDIDRWRQLVAAYKELEGREQHLYPVCTVHNDYAVSEALDQILATVAALNLTSGSVECQRAVSHSSQHMRERLQDASPTVFSRLSPAEPTEVYNTYWRFAIERQAIFFQKFKGLSPPWTADPILARYKFTNAYRASDRTSQYLIRHVIYQGDQSPEEVFFRTILFKLFNRIETWQLLEANLGGVRYAEYAFERYNAILNRALESSQRIYSAAYIMPPPALFGYTKKHSNHLKLLERMMEDEVSMRLVDKRSMQQAFELLRSYPTLGDFLAYQYVTDINYSACTHFTEMEFVVPGPGARDGIRKCFRHLGGLNEVDVIRLMVERQEEECARLGLSFQSLWGRSLQLIDCQNLFCEVSKYARLAHPEIQGTNGRTRIKQIYQPHPKPITYWYPPKWELNDLIAAKERGTHVSL